MFAVTNEAALSFDVFISHANHARDNEEVRLFARRLEAAGLTVWLAEEQLPAGVKPRDAISSALEASRHVLIWLTDNWQKQASSEWELNLFVTTLKNNDRRVVPVLRVPPDLAAHGPHISNLSQSPMNATRTSRFGWPYAEYETSHREAEAHGRKEAEKLRQKARKGAKALRFLIHRLQFRNLSALKKNVSQPTRRITRKMILA